MILADTSVWVDYFRGENHEMGKLINAGEIVMHPFIVAEVALGSLRNRRRTLREMERLRKIKVAHVDEVRHMIEARSLYSKGIGLTDAHLVASCLMTPGTRLWTRDAALEKVARSLGILTHGTS